MCVKAEEGEVVILEIKDGKDGIEEFFPKERMMDESGDGDDF
ncbi:hypothetical protein [Phosphitispora fastidiosa]|nr:hypothetical protein [Phosphitispora fastidiosa]MBU7006873.1 hypothetical protein [Phosphitispora fastidiosa]